MNKDIKEAVEILGQYDDQVVTLEKFNELEELANVYWVNNGVSGNNPNNTYYSFYVVEDGVDYEDCESNHTEEFTIYLNSSK